MQIQRLQDLIKNPGKTQLSDRSGLIEWVRKYPYAGGFSLLLARSSAVGGHINQQDDLLRAAAGSSLRQPLFDLILRTELIQEARLIDEVIEAAPDVLDLEIEKKEVFVEGDMDEKSNDSGQKSLDSDDPMEREALIAAIGRSIEKDVTSWGTEASSGALKELSKEDGERLRNATSSPFSMWLSTRAEALNYGGVSALMVSSTKGEKPADVSGLIDRFIAANPRIGPLRETAPDVHALAQKSVMEDPTLVTETMARLYAKQGQINKARKAYALLALKNPAKSTYFAAQLKGLDKGGSV